LCAHPTKIKGKEQSNEVKAKVIKHTGYRYRLVEYYETSQEDKGGILEEKNE
jgi:hypothetical protein